MADAYLLTDIRLELGDHRLRPIYSAAAVERRLPGRPAPTSDLDVVQGRDNLSQAVIVRLLTPRGELTALGHPEFGSRLHELIGRENTETTRNLVKLFILDALQFEPRLQPKARVAVAPDPVRRDRVNVQIEATPVGRSETVTIGPFTLELGP